jgi:hypothetical protein
MIIADVVLLPRSELPTDAVRNSTPIGEVDAVWHESWAPKSLRKGVGAPVLEGGHSGHMCGRVSLVYEHGAHHRAELELDDSVDVEVGQAVSIQCVSHGWDDDQLLHLRRHGLAFVEHVALLSRGRRPRYPQARVVGVRRVEPRRLEQPAKPVEEAVLSREEPTILRRNCGTILGIR